MRKTLISAAMLAIAAAAGGCSGTERLLAFATATTFGLDISLRADDNVNVIMGYDRAEIASIPVDDGNDATADGTKNDAYSVLGYFHVDYGSPWPLGSGEKLHLKQLIATGLAAQESSKQGTALQDFLGKKAGAIAAKEEAK